MSLPTGVGSRANEQAAGVPDNSQTLLDSAHSVASRALPAHDIEGAPQRAKHWPSEASDLLSRHALSQTSLEALRPALISASAGTDIIDLDLDGIDGHPFYVEANVSKTTTLTVRLLEGFPIGTTRMLEGVPLSAFFLDELPFASIRVKDVSRGMNEVFSTPQTLLANLLSVCGGDGQLLCGVSHFLSMTSAVIGVKALALRDGMMANQSFNLPDDQGVVQLSENADYHFDVSSASIVSEKAAAGMNAVCVEIHASISIDRVWNDAEQGEWIASPASVLAGAEFGSKIALTTSVQIERSLHADARAGAIVRRGKTIMEISLQDDMRAAMSSMRDLEAI